jgi:hypothetical protein
MDGGCGGRVQGKKGVCCMGRAGCGREVPNLCVGSVHCPCPTADHVPALFPLLPPCGCFQGNEVLLESSFEALAAISGAAYESPAAVRAACGWDWTW